MPKHSRRTKKYIYLIYLRGMYGHGVHGVYYDRQDAIRKCDKLAENDRDDYHEWQVFQVTANTTVNISDYSSDTDGFMDETPIYSVRKAPRENTVADPNKSMGAPEQWNPSADGKAYSYHYTLPNGLTVEFHSEDTISNLIYKKGYTIDNMGRSPESVGEDEILKDRHVLIGRNTIVIGDGVSKFKDLDLHSLDSSRMNEAIISDMVKRHELTIDEVHPDSHITRQMFYTPTIISTDGLADTTILPKAVVAVCDNVNGLGKIGDGFTMLRDLPLLRVKDLTTPKRFCVIHEPKK